MAGETSECGNSHCKEKSWACSPGDCRIQLGALLPAAEGFAMELAATGAMAGRGHQCISGGGVLGNMVTGTDIIPGWTLLGI